MTETAMADLENVACNLCGGRDFKPLYRKPDEFYLRDDWFQVVACKSCGLGFVNPRPTVMAIQRYYPGDYFTYHFKSDSARLSARYQRQATYLEAAGAAAGGPMPRLLDIGCANGDFPRFMRKVGWDVEGVETADNSESVNDFHCYRSLDEIPGDARYDAITAWAVMEHVHDPMSVFAGTARLLKKGGVFIALTTNLDSVSSRYLFREDIPRHLYFFSPRTVAAYAAKTSCLTLEGVKSGSEIYQMAPLHWLRHFLRRAVGLPALQWNDLPEIRYAYFERTGRSPNLSNTLRYIATHPFTVVDRALMRHYAKWQEFVGTYGLVIYILRKEGDDPMSHHPRT